MSDECGGCGAGLFTVEPGIKVCPNCDWVEEPHPFTARGEGE